MTYSAHGIAAPHPVWGLINKAWAMGIDFLLPPTCPACRTMVSHDGSYCPECWARLEFITAPLCACCGLPLAFDLGADAQCGECLLLRPRFTSARSAFLYTGAAREVLLAFKNGGREYLAAQMAPPMARAGGDWFEDQPVLVPVPLHRWRFWQRGFNQSALLAQAIARQKHCDVMVDALLRIRPTRRSRGMSRKQRAANVRGVFRVNDPEVVIGRTVILIDDVLTTGATAQACARLLLRKGAKKVHVLTWARVVSSV